jgi:hypothetical protein
MPVSIPVALLAWAFATIHVLKRSRLAARITDDVELGWVITVDHQDLPRPETAADNSQEGDDVELPAQGVETLLHTRLDWTVNRRPATWRRFGTRLD